MNFFLTQTEILLKEKCHKALLGGFLASFVFALVGVWSPCEIPEHDLIITQLVPTLCLQHTSCIAIHFTVGTILLPILYLTVGIKYIMGSSIVKGILFSVPVYFIVMIVILFLDRDLLLYNPLKALHVLINYMIYGSVLGFVTGKIEKSNSYTILGEKWYKPFRVIKVLSGKKRDGKQ